MTYPQAIAQNIRDRKYSFWRGVEILCGLSELSEGRAIKLLEKEFCK